MLDDHIWHLYLVTTFLLMTYNVVNTMTVFLGYHLLTQVQCIRIHMHLKVVLITIYGLTA